MVEEEQYIDAPQSQGSAVDPHVGIFHPSVSRYPAKSLPLSAVTMLVASFGCSLELGCLSITGWRKHCT